jgi:hypothetical protein
MNGVKRTSERQALSHTFMFTVYSYWRERSLNIFWLNGIANFSAITHPTTPLSCQHSLTASLGRPSFSMKISALIIFSVHTYRYMAWLIIKGKGEIV